MPKPGWLPGAKKTFRNILNKVLGEDGIPTAKVDKISVSEVYAKIYLSTTQTVSGDDVWYDVDFDAIEHDDFDGYDTEAGEYVIQESGVYLLAVKVEAAGIGMGNYLACRAVVNGEVISRHFTHAGADSTVSSSTSSADYFEEGDTIDTQVKQDSGGSVDLETGKMATYAHLAKIG